MLELRGRTTLPVPPNPKETFVSCLARVSFVVLVGKEIPVVETVYLHSASNYYTDWPIVCKTVSPCLHVSSSKHLECPGS